MMNYKDPKCLAMCASVILLIIAVLLYTIKPKTKDEKTNKMIVDESKRSKMKKSGHVVLVLAIISGIYAAFLHNKDKPKTTSSLASQLASPTFF